MLKNVVRLFLTNAIAALWCVAAAQASRSRPHYWYRELNKGLGVYCLKLNGISRLCGVRPPLRHSVAVKFFTTREMRETREEFMGRVNARPVSRDSPISCGVRPPLRHSVAVKFFTTRESRETREEFMGRVNARPVSRDSPISCGVRPPLRQSVAVIFLQREQHAIPWPIEHSRRRRL